MKRLLACLLISSMILSFGGCSLYLPEEVSETPLSLMKKINDTNPLHSDMLCRIWYQIETSFFADSNSDAIGDIAGIMQYLDYLSDGNVDTSDTDLNMTGIFLNELLQVDVVNAPVDYYTIRPEYGQASDLARLCEEASRRKMDVMISLDLATISLSSSCFLDLLEAAEQLDKKGKPSDLSYEYAGMFYLDTEAKDETWLPLGSSPLYYKAFEGTSTPVINQNDNAWRQLISNVVNYYMNLGVKGFFIPDASSIFPDDAKKNREFLSWFNSLVKKRDPYATVVASCSTYTGELASQGAAIAPVDFSGAEGYISKAVTGAMSASELGDLLKDQTSPAAYSLTNAGSNMDLIKSPSRVDELKMALALLTMMSGQVFISAGDEIGLADDEVHMISDAIQEPDSSNKGEELELTFGSLLEQRSNGDSIFSFLQEAVRLRNSFGAISQGTSEILEDLCTESLLVIRKDTEESSVVLVFNLSSQTSSMDTSSILLHGLPAQLGGVLLCTTDPISLDDDVLTLPPHSAAVLK